MLPAILEYAAPTTLDEAIALIDSRGDAIFDAGNPSLIHDLKARRLDVSLLIDLRRLPGMDMIVVSDAAIEIGGAVTLRTLAADTRVLQHFPALAAAAESAGDPQSRGMTTIAGSIDYDRAESPLASVLMALGASMTLHESAKGVTRTVADALADNVGRMILSSFSVPLSPGTCTTDSYLHPASLAPLVSVAVYNSGDTRRVAIAGSVRRAVVADSIEAALSGCDWFDVLGFSAEYRAARAQVMAGRLGA